MTTNNKSNPNRVLRGGDWFNYANYAGCANRNDYYPDFASNDYGFRAVLKKMTTNNNTDRVLRGGNWNYFAGHARRAYRFNNSPDYAYISIGFRAVLKPTNQQPYNRMTTNNPPTIRVLRGGDWFGDGARCADRGGSLPGLAYDGYGVRLVLKKNDYQ